MDDYGNRDKIKLEIEPWPSTVEVSRLYSVATTSTCVFYLRNLTQTNQSGATSEQGPASIRTGPFSRQQAKLRPRDSEQGGVDSRVPGWRLQGGQPRGHDFRETQGFVKMTVFLNLFTDECYSDLRD